MGDKYTGQGHLKKEQVLECLVPPKLIPQQKLVCTRAVRDGQFNISIEKQGSKTVVHCYGFGGAGWTVLFGAVARAVELLVPQPRRPVRVVGAGCMGLLAAIELTKLGFPVRIVADELYDIPSWKAAGYFAMVSVKTSPEYQAELDAMGRNTFRAYQKVERGEHPFLTPETTRLMPVYASEATPMGLEELEAGGLIPARESVVLDFGTVQHPGYLKFKTYFLDTTLIMKQLHAHVKQLYIPIDRHRVGSWQEVAEEIVFNAAGFGGRELVRDETVVPVKGHLITLQSQSPAPHMDYMIYTDVLQGDKKERIYLFPKNLSVTREVPHGTPCSGVLGGTFVHPGTATTDEREFERMLQRAELFFTGKVF